MDNSSMQAQVSTSKTVLLDSSGLPLSPQPTDSPFDPLNYPNWLKYTILLQVSFLAFFATMNVAIINPAVVPLAAEFRILPVTATYQTTVAIGTSALGPLLFTPFANVYGRRSAYLLSVLIGVASAVGSATAPSFKRLVIARAFNGFGPSAALGLGAGTVVDLFFVHQRGKAVGLFTVMLTSGSHLAPIVGGYASRNLGWRWCFWVGAMLNAAMFCICFFFLPETIFDRPVQDETDLSLAPDDEGAPDPKEYPKEMATEIIYSPPPMTFSTYLNRLWFWDLQRPAHRRLKKSDFVIKPLRMLQYPSVAFPALYYAVTYGFASIEPALTVATLFTKIYHFDTVRNGLANGVSLLLGAALGELCSGPVTDRMMQRARRIAISEGKPVSAEVRLQGIWTGAILVPLGLLMYPLSFRSFFSADIPIDVDVLVLFCFKAVIETAILDGFTIRFANTFVAPCIGMAVACFGIQIVTSVCYTYSCSDCYRSHSNDVSQCFNFFRQVFGLTLGFYSLPFGDKIGFEWSFTVFAVICMLAFLPILLLMYRGEKWRVHLGPPKLR